MTFQRTPARIALVALVGVGLVGPAAITTASTAEAKSTVLYGRVKHIADGDTIDVDLRGDGTHRRIRIRYLAVQATEIKHYAKSINKISGECWSVDAAKYLHKLIYHKKVRLTSRLGTSRPKRGTLRLRRFVAVYRDGKWRDTGALLIKAGLVLPEPTRDEHGKNKKYQQLGQQAAANHVGMWGNSSHCGSGPSQGAPLKVTVNWDADGADPKNVNGEWVEVRNTGSSDVSLAGWWVRDTSNRAYQGHGYTFPSGTVVRAGSQIRLHAGKGGNDATSFHWGLSKPAFVNPGGSPLWLGDGGFLFDPNGDLRGWDMYPCFYAC